MNELAPKDTLPAPSAIEAAIMCGDLSKLSAEQRGQYVTKLCETMGLNLLTKPFEFMTLQGKLVCYAGKNCAEQLRKVHNVSIKITSASQVGDLHVVIAEASIPSGRTDSSSGAISISGLKGEALANALMKAETKAKRRVTLSICSLGMLDETEVESIPQARVFASAPGPQDGVQAVPRASIAPNGTFARRDLHEIPVPELRKTVDRMMCEPKLSLDEQQWLERAAEYLVTVDQIEQDNDSDSFEPPEPSAKPKCTCGSDLVPSKTKPVYYCPQFKGAGDHIRSIPKEVYEQA